MQEGTDSEPRPLFAVVDVYYPAGGGARSAMVVARQVTFSKLIAEWTADVAAVPAYQPGQFFLRELPPLRAALDGLTRLDGELRMIVIDGYVDLDPDGGPGLGAHVHEEYAVPVIGVAKTAFRTATHAIPVLRGAATRPLYVTAAGLPRARAAEIVRQMAGPFRLPDALRRADELSRTAPMRP